MTKNTLYLIASDMLNNNSFMTIIYALSNKDLDSLTIMKDENKTFYSSLTDCEKNQLISIMHIMCKKKSETTWTLKLAAL